MTNNIKLVQLIIQELGALGYHPQGDKRVLIHCPFHNDTNPSLIVPLIHKKYNPGQFKCFSCGAKGDWNKLAERLRLKEWDLKDQNKYYDNSKKEYAEEDAFKDLMFSVDKLENKQEVLSLHGIEELPTDFSWRGIPRSFWVESEYTRHRSGVYHRRHGSSTPRNNQATSGRRHFRHEQGTRIAGCYATHCNYLLAYCCRIAGFHGSVASKSTSVCVLHQTILGRNAGW